MRLASVKRGSPTVADRMRLMIEEALYRFNPEKNAF